MKFVKITKKMIGFSAVLMCCASVFAQKMDVESAIQRGIEYHDLARKQGQEYCQKVCDVLEPFINENAIACAYYGSAQTVMASFVAEKNPMKSLEYLQNGGDYLDKAVRLDPENGFVRMIHLENGIEVSRNSPLKRYSAIRSDVEWFLDDENVLKMEPDMQAEAYLYCGFFKLEEGDLDYALELFENAVDAAPESRSAVQAKKQLDKYTE